MSRMWVGHALEWHVMNIGLYPTGHGETPKGFKQGRETHLDLNLRITLEFLDWETEWMEILTTEISLVQTFLMTLHGLYPFSRLREGVCQNIPDEWHFVPLFWFFFVMMFNSIKNQFKRGLKTLILMRRGRRAIGKARFLGSVFKFVHKLLHSAP